MIPLAILLLWFLLGFTVYFAVYRIDFITSLKSAFYIKQVSNEFANAYNTWGDAVILGMAFAVIFQNIIEKYNPMEGCRMLAKEMANHYVVVGYTHLGERLIEYFAEKNIPYVLIDEYPEKIDHLLKRGDPVVVDNPAEKDVIEDANIAKAKAVIITIDKFETSILLTKRIKDVNKDCLVIVRNFHDELAEVLESLGANEIISGSKTAMSDILAKLNLKR